MNVSVGMLENNKEIVGDIEKHAISTGVSKMSKWGIFPSIAYSFLDPVNL